VAQVMGTAAKRINLPVCKTKQFARNYYNGCLSYRLSERNRSEDERFHTDRLIVATELLLLTQRTSKTNELRVSSISRECESLTPRCKERR